MISDKAADDLDEIAEYPNRQDADLGFRFLDFVEMAFGEFARMPGLNPQFKTANPRLEGVRCGSVPGFPNHLVFYLTNHDSIEIVRVLDAARDLKGLLGIESD